MLTFWKVTKSGFLWDYSCRNALAWHCGSACREKRCHLVSAADNTTHTHTHTHTPQLKIKVIKTSSPISARNVC